MSPRSPVVQKLLRTLDLPASASKTDIRAAYLRQVKLLHPDVAGKSAEERFRQLKDDYEKAMEAMKNGESTTSAGPTQNPYRHYQTHQWQQAGFRPGQGAHQQHWDPGKSANWSNAAEAAPSWADLTPAQRLRNVALGAGGIFAVFVYMSMPSPARQYGSSSSSSQLSATSSAAPRAQLADESAANQVVRTKSDYYKNRLSRSSVRVRSSDTYVSPSEAAKSRQPMDGVQYAAPEPSARQVLSTAAVESVPMQPAPPVPMASTAAAEAMQVPAELPAISTAAAKTLQVPPAPQMVSAAAVQAPPPPPASMATTAEAPPSQTAA